MALVGESGLEQQQGEQGGRRWVVEITLEIQEANRDLCPQYEDRRADWITNEAGFSHSHQHGFGLLKAWRLVNAAKVNRCRPGRGPHGMTKGGLTA